MNIQVRLRNQQAFTLNFMGRGSSLLEANLEVVEKYRAQALTYARQIVPVDTGRMRRSLRAEYVSGRPPSAEALMRGAGTEGRIIWQLFYDEAVFKADGVTYYPVYVEYGTSRMAARPTLRMTMDRIENPFRQEMMSTMRRAA